MVKSGPRSVPSLEIQNAKDKIREEARRRGLLHRYDFSGIVANGVSRNDAAEQLMKQARARAFDLLRKEFGASAHFWPRASIRIPVLREVFSVDFYWRKANLGVELTGPLVMNRVTGELKRSHGAPDFPVEFMDPRYQGEAKHVKIMKLPYYLLWHDPSRFVGEIRKALVASGKFPNL